MMNNNRNRNWIINIIGISILIGIVLYICWEIDRSMKEMDAIKDAFFSALINKDFEELDQIMADDAWFVAQGCTYSELRDGIQENFETYVDVKSQDDMNIRDDIPGRKLGTPDFRKMIVDYEIVSVMDGSGRMYIVKGRLEISRMQGGTYKITLVDQELVGLEATGKIIDIEEDIFGPILGY